MKKAIISALASAFIIPGLGQVLNQQIKKGVLILSTVLILFVLSVIQLYLVLSQIFKNAPSASIDTNTLVEGFKNQDPATFYLLVILFILLWAYSVVDAFICGLREQKKG